MGLDRAIEAAAEALLDDEELIELPSMSVPRAARIAIEAAAPHIHPDECVEENEAWRERAERAEAEVERLLADCGDHVSLAVVEDVGNQLRNERALADELAEALRTALGSHIAVALAAYEEARRG